MFKNHEINTVYAKLCFIYHMNFFNWNSVLFFEFYRKFKKMIMLNQKGGFQMITVLFSKKEAITQASYKEE